MVDPGGYSRAPHEVLEARRALAEKVRVELVRAGLPAAPDPFPDEVVGAAVEVDEGDDRGGGVYVGWTPSREVVDASVEMGLVGRFDAPVQVHAALIDEAMQGAILSVLRSAGFAVVSAEEAGDDSRPFGVRVTAGPP